MEIINPGGGGNTPSITILTQADSPYTLKATDQYLAFSLGGNMVVNLPSGALNKGRRLPFVRLDFNGFSITFNAFAGENVDGQVSAVVIGSGASYAGGELIGVGNDGIGFINGWHVHESDAGMLRLTAGPSLVPLVAALKLGSVNFPVQPYVKGFYFAQPQVFTVLDSPLQLQSYHDRSTFSVAGGNIVATLNLATFGQLRLLRVRAGATGNTVTINAAGGDNIDGVGAIIMAEGQGVIMCADGIHSWDVFAVK